MTGSPTAVGLRAGTQGRSAAKSCSRNSMWRPQARMSPSIRRWPTRCMPTRLWKPTAGTGLANSAQLAGEAVRPKAALSAAPFSTTIRSPTWTVNGSVPPRTAKESAASRARRCSAALPSSAAARREKSIPLVAHLDVGVLDHLGPLGNVAGDGGACLLGRAADGVETEGRELLLHLGIRQHLQR